MSTKVDPRVTRTEEYFENALLDLMEQKEFAKITVQEIAKQARLNRATFYLHYFDKEDLLQKCLDNALIDLEESVEIPEVEFQYSTSAPHPVFVRIFDQMLKHSRFYRIMLAENKAPYFSAKVMKIIEALVDNSSRTIEKAGIQKNVPREISVAYITTAYLGVIVWWLNHDMPYSPSYMATQLTLMSTVGPFKNNPFVSS